MDETNGSSSRQLETDAESMIAQHAGLASQPNEPTKFETTTTRAGFQNPNILTPSDVLREAEVLEDPEQKEGDLARRQAIVKKIENPQAYRFLLVAEAALYFRVAPRTIHRWQLDSKLRNGGRRGSVTTESVRQWETKRRRKRRSK